MKSRSLYKNSVVFAAMTLALLLSGSATFAQSSAFTYQGRLTDGGAAANGNYDLQFALWDSLSGGTQIGSVQTLNTIAVSSGVFTVSLDFGANSFPGANRFLEISARPSGTGSFTLLAPRQQVTSTPYAVRSASSANADAANTATNATQLGGIAAGQYVQTSDSRLSDARPPTAGSGNYIQNGSNQQSSTNFNISGNGTVGGTLSGNAINATTQLNIGGNRVLSASSFSSATSVFLGFGTGNLGPFNAFVGGDAGRSNTTGQQNSFFGENGGAANTQGDGNSFFGFDTGSSNNTGSYNTFLGQEAGSRNTSGSTNVFVGISAGKTNTTGNDNAAVGDRADVGAISLTNATAIGASALVTQSNSLVLGSIQGLNFAPANTSVGIGTTAPVSRFHVKGTSWFQGDTTPLVTAAGRGVAIGTGTNSNNNYGFVFAYDYGANTVSDLLLNYPGGRVGIGTFNPDQTLTVNGNASKVGGGSWATFSDERLKNITGRFTPGLKAVMQLQPLRYEYKRDNALNLKSEGEHVGFSAQAVREIIPEAVSKNDQGYLLVNNDPILWTMLNAIKEQQAQIGQQQKEIVALKKLVCRSRGHAKVCK